MSDISFVQNKRSKQRDVSPTPWWIHALSTDTVSHINQMMHSLFCNLIQKNYRIYFADYHSTWMSRQHKVLQVHTKIAPKF
jgi:hypothetical protein